MILSGHSNFFSPLSYFFLFLFLTESILHSTWVISTMTVLLRNARTFSGRLVMRLSLGLMVQMVQLSSARLSGSAWAAGRSSDCWSCSTTTRRAASSSKTTSSIDICVLFTTQPCTSRGDANLFCSFSAYVVDRRRRGRAYVS